MSRSNNIQWGITKHSWFFKKSTEEPAFLEKIMKPFQNRGVQRPGDARGNCLIVCPPPNSIIEEGEKYRQL